MIPLPTTQPATMKIAMGRKKSLRQVRTQIMNQPSYQLRHWFILFPDIFSCVCGANFLSVKELTDHQIARKHYGCNQCGKVWIRSNRNPSSNDTRSDRADRLSIWNRNQIKSINRFRSINQINFIKSIGSLDQINSFFSCAQQWSSYNSTKKRRDIIRRRFRIAKISYFWLLIQINLLVNDMNTFFEQSKIRIWPSFKPIHTFLAVNFSFFFAFFLNDFPFFFWYGYTPANAPTYLVRFSKLLLKF